MDCLWGHGARFWIVGLQDPAVFIPAIKALRLQGRWRIEAYEYLYQSQGPEQMVRTSIHQLQAGGVLQDVCRLWLDYESGAEMWGDGEADQALHLADVCESYGLPSGIYSSQGWLAGNISSAALHRLSVLELWLAYWNNQPNESMPWPAPPLWGWQTFHTKQYSGDQGSLCGLTVDWNWRPDSVWDAEEDDLATPESLLAAARAMNRAQLGELNNILQQGVMSLVGAPSPVQEPGLYAHDDNQYHDPGDLTRGSFDHWIKDQAEDGGGGPGGVTEQEARRMAREEIANSTIMPKGGLG
jgi:hypothetical protein